MKVKRVVGKKYRISHKIASGGQGEIYLASYINSKVKFHRNVVIKIIEKKVSNEKAINEIEYLSKINHPNISTILDAGEEDNYFFIVIEYIEGVNLKDFKMGLVEKNLALNEDGVVDIINSILTSFRIIHEKNTPPLLHKDISPHNIMITKDGIVKLIDFGISESIDQINPNITSGKPKYLSPEVLNKTRQYSIEDEYYSLAIVIYEFIQKRPFVIGESIDLELVENKRLKTVIELMLHDHQKLLPHKEILDIDDSNLIDVSEKICNKNFIIEHTYRAIEKKKSSQGNLNRIYIIILFCLIATFITIPSIFWVLNKTEKMYPLQGKYNNSKNKTLSISKNQIKMTIKDMNGCETTTTWLASKFLKNKGIVTLEDKYRVNEMVYDVQNKVCIEKAESIRMIPSLDNRHLQFELKLDNQTLHLKKLNPMSFDESVELFVVESAKIYEKNFWK